MCQACQTQNISSSSSKTHNITLSAQDYEKMKDFISQLNCKVSISSDTDMDTDTNIDTDIVTVDNNSVVATTNTDIIDNSTNSSAEHIDLRPIKNQTFDEIIKEYGMTNEQVEFYKKYSMERSRRAYEIVALKELGSSGLIDDWVYYGYYDSGRRGNEYCEAGHPLRYVHIAYNKKTGKELKFGIKCVTDFFNLSPAQLKFIKNGFNEANAEIQQGIDKFVKYNGNFDEYENKFHYEAKLNFITNNKPDMLRLDSDNLIHMLKLGELKYMFSLKLFLPDNFERLINYTYYNVKQALEQEKIIEQRNLHPLLINRKDIVTYIQQNHADIYKIILSLTKSDHPSDKQKNFLNKLLNTPWQQVDEIISGVKNGTIIVKNGFMKQSYIDITNCYYQYGITEKQFNFLKKTITYKK